MSKIFLILFDIAILLVRKLRLNVSNFGGVRTSYLGAPLPLVWTMTIMAIRNNTSNRTGMIRLVLMERKRREKWRVPKANELPTRFVEQITLRAAVYSVRKERFDKNRNQAAEMLIIPDITAWQ